MRTLLAISQIPSLALDLVDWVFGILDIGHVRGGNPTRIPEDGDGVVVDAHDRHGGENGGVH